MIVTRLIRAGLALTMVGALTGGVGATPSLAREASASVVPYQFVSKLYTEGLGRLPSQSEWRSGVRYFSRSGCGPASLAVWGLHVLGSSELRGRGYDRFSLTLVGYRAVLNRDPSEDELARLSRAAHGPLAAPLLLARLYASSEFHSLATEICDASEPSYHFGTTAAPTLPTGVVGFTGTQAQLQALLDATPAGGTVSLAAKAVVRLSSPLTVPAGVGLTTHGEPDTRHYATMARLVRDTSGAGFEAAMVRVLPGGRLTHVWVDGQMGRPERYVGHGAYNVQTLGGTGTQVSHDRLTNAAGGTNLSALGGSDTGNRCVNNEFDDNLVDGYASSHWARLLDGGGVVGPWADGLSIACEDAEVTGNEIVDATDVGLIVFSQNGIAQRSRLTDNVILNAGNSAFASLASSPGLNPLGVGDEAGMARMDFTGTVMAGNLMWNTPAAPNGIGISVGVRPWTAEYSYNGHGIRVQDNSSGQEGIWAGNGVVVSGMLDATVTGNDLNVHVVDGAPLCTTAVEGIYRRCGTPSATSLCPPGEVGVDLEGFASGTIDDVSTRRSFSGCIVGAV